ncbi:hypothetical protein TNCV_3883741 [Trichonephila clavipes]|nr:hypothetical protein TNCV_3883741 [Trichonephila clavipes]
MVLHCRRRVWSRIVIQQQNARSEKPRPLFPNHCSQSLSGCHNTALGIVTPWFQPPKSPLKRKRFFRMQIPEFSWRIFEAYKAI